MKKKYIFGGIIFKTKKEVVNKIKEILHKNHNSFLSGEDYNIIKDIMLMHYRIDEKLPGGIKNLERIDVKETYCNGRSTWCFLIVRKDGAVVDFSIYKALNNDINVIKKNNIIQRLRYVIKPQCDRYRAMYLATMPKIAKNLFLCELSKLWFNRSEIHVDHIIPFNLIIEKFKNTYGIDFDKIETEESEDGFGCTIKDKNIEETFSLFHNKYAKLRCIHKILNLRLPDKEIIANKEHKVVKKFIEEFKNKSENIENKNSYLSLFDI